MSTGLLVLGGSNFVGRALVNDGLARGWKVTTFTRNRSGHRDPRAAHITGDRIDAATLAPLSERDWDLVADTWSGAPRAVRDSARTLADHAGRYAYVSSGSVYPPPMALGLDEDSPTVAAQADALDADYPSAKRGLELASETAFGNRALLVRAGSIVGLHDDVGRLPWWLARMSAGGEVLAPGPANLRQQFIDARDLARFVLDAAMAGHGGPFNVVSRRGHATMGELLEACRAVAGAPDARLHWVAPEVIQQAGIEPWSELPLWIPPGSEYEGMLGMDTERAHAAGLRCRPVTETVADTWAWMGSLPGPVPRRADLPSLGLAPAKERAALSLAHHL